MVWPKRSAADTARLDGADTAHSTGIPAIAGLLHQLEREPARHEEHLRLERQRAVEQRVTDQLVERVVPTDVFARGNELPARGEPRRGMETTGLVEHPLVRAQPIGQRLHDTRTDLRARHPPARCGSRPRRARPCRRCRTTSSRGTGGIAHSSGTRCRSRTVTMLYCCSGFSPVTAASAVRQYATVSMSVADSRIPSVRHKPTASSKSLPGVRIVTANGAGSWPGPNTRISIGSSVASRSRRAVAMPASTVNTRADVTGRRTTGSRDCTLSML